MFQKPLAFLLLLSHVNFFMFIAQVDEVDAYDSKGCRINDINTLCQYIDEVVLNHHSKPRPDEDDDNARYFHIVKLSGYTFNRLGFEIDSKPCRNNKRATYPLYIAKKPFAVTFEVLTPPPRS